MSKIEMEKRTYKLTGITPMLGSQPANPDVRTAYIAAKAPLDVNAEEAEYLPDIEEQSLTVFLRDPANGSLMLLDYMVKAFFKSSLEALKAQNGIKAARGKVDKWLFVSPRKVDILRNGKPVIEEDSVFERPLRAQTMQGERVALRASEQIDDPWTIEFTVTLLPNEKTKVSANVTWEDVETALDYGEVSGIGQFRNGGWGRFTWERVDK